MSLAIMRTRIPDPIHGTIEMPHWLRKIIDEKPVRRMMFIRQLGLKAYIDFPGAIHTRYSHVLGVMNLAGKIVNMISENEKFQGNDAIITNLDANKETIMAAGFLHDIGHGPFSHALDYVIKKFTNKSHEDIAFEVIDKLPDVETDGIIKSKVKDIIKGKHSYPFVSQIVNGPLDADKLDYLLRDAHHVGLKYSLDLEYFINHFKILGIDASNLEKCELGLSANNAAIVTAEIFVVIWKSMYDLVYHVENSRIAEKMLEKAILLRIADDVDFKNNFISINKFLDLNDERLLDLLRTGTGLPKDLGERIANNKLYINVYDKEINTSNFFLNEKFLEELSTNADQLAHNMNKILIDTLKCADEELICDIIKGRAPKTINIDCYEKDTGDPVELKNFSDVVRAIREKSYVRVYVPGRDIKLKLESLITENLPDIIRNWS
jgi:HD superfamily phosphohydrolase